MAYGDIPWSEAEDAVIRDHYPLGGTEHCISLLPGRTRRAIGCRADKLDISFRGSRQLINVDEDRVVTLYSSGRTVEEITDLLATTQHAVIRTVRKHKLKAPPRRTIDTHRDALTADYLSGTMTNAKLCTTYNVSKSELTRALRRWGVHDPMRKAKLVTSGAMRPNRRPAYDCWAERFGVDEANRRHAAWLEGQRVNSSGANNPMYGKPTPQGSGNGWKGWYKEHYFRSLREACFMARLDREGVQWQSAEALRIPYTFEGRERTYRPDYLIGSHVVEIKPQKLHDTPSVTAKRLAAERYCADRDLVYEVLDQAIDPEALKAAWEQGLIRWDRDYEQRFKEWLYPPAPRSE